MEIVLYFLFVTLDPKAAQEVPITHPLLLANLPFHRRGLFERLRSLNEWIEWPAHRTLWTELNFE